MVENYFKIVNDIYNISDNRFFSQEDSGKRGHPAKLFNKSSAVAEMSDRLATIDIGRKLGGGLCPLFGKEEMGPHLAQCGQGRGLPACQVSS